MVLLVGRTVPNRAKKSIKMSPPTGIITKHSETQPKTSLSLSQSLSLSLSEGKLLQPSYLTSSSLKPVLKVVTKVIK